MATGYYHLRKKDFPLVPGSDQRDFAVLARQAARKVFEQGKGFQVCITSNGDGGMDALGQRADYDASVMAIDLYPQHAPLRPGRTLAWTSLGLMSPTSDDCVYESFLPAWLFAEANGFDHAIEMAETYAQSLRQLRAQIDVLWDGINARPSDATHEDIRDAALAWQGSGLWMCSDESGMYVLDHRQGAPGVPPEGHAIYPQIAIVTGTMPNSKALDWTDPDYVKACLQDLCRRVPANAGEEYILADARLSLKSVRDGQPCAFVRTAWIAAGLTTIRERSKEYEHDRARA